MSKRVADLPAHRMPHTCCQRANWLFGNAQVLAEQLHTLDVFLPALLEAERWEALNDAAGG